jgi:hypothetical protein
VLPVEERGVVVELLLLCLVVRPDRPSGTLLDPVVLWPALELVPGVPIVELLDPVVL